jgi:hypothetical protein
MLPVTFTGVLVVLDLDVTRGAPLFQDTVRALVGAAQEADDDPLEFADKIFHRPDKHPEPLARGEGDLRLLAPYHVASDVHGGTGRAKGGHRERDDPGRRPRRAARKDVGQVAGTTHLTRPTGAGSVDTSLADLRHLFRWHFGPILKRYGQALVEMMLPFTAPLAERVVVEAVSFEVFWPWILGRYLRPAHPNAARSMWKAMGDKRPRPPRWPRMAARSQA